MNRSSKTDPVEVIDGFIEQTASFSGQIVDEQPFLSDNDPVPISDQVISSSVAARGYSFFIQLMISRKQVANEAQTERH